MTICAFSDTNTNERQEVGQERDERAVQALPEVWYIWSDRRQLFCHTELYI